MEFYLFSIEKTVKEKTFMFIQSNNTCLSLYPFFCLLWVAIFSQ